MVDSSNHICRCIWSQVRSWSGPMSLMKSCNTRSCLMNAPQLWPVRLGDAMKKRWKVNAIRTRADDGTCDRFFCRFKVIKRTNATKIFRDIVAIVCMSKTWVRVKRHSKGLYSSSIKITETALELLNRMHSVTLVFDFSTLLTIAKIKRRMSLHSFDHYFFYPLWSSELWTSL